MINAVADKIVVKYLKASKTASGLFIPEAAQEPQGFGLVLSVGDLIPDNIKVDDIVVFHVRAGMDLIMDKEIWKCLKYEEVYGVLDDDKMAKLLQPFVLGAPEQSKIVKPGGTGGVVIAP